MRSSDKSTVISRIFGTSLILSLFAMFLCGCGTDAPESIANHLPETTIHTNVSSPSTLSAELTEDATAPESMAMGSFRMTMLDVGQGLCILLEADGRTMLYDGGGRQSSSYVVSYLEHAGITDLDIMIASHYDEDHIAGLIGCLHNYSVGSLICPDYETDTNIYKSFFNAVTLTGADVIHPRTGSHYSLGQATVTVLAPDEYSSTKENDSSIAVRIEYGSFCCILTGDAEGEEEQYMIDSNADLKADLLVAGHHGSKYSSTQSFLEAVSPAVVWISCGLENSFGHPASETMQALQDMNIDLYRTDLQGEIICTSDGMTYSFNVDACTNYSSGDSESDILTLTPLSSDDSTSISSRTIPEETETVENHQQEYVLNTNTRKIHLPSCSSVNQMKEKNREYVTADRDDLIAQGYSPCGNCHP